MFPVASIYTTRHVGGRRWKLETGDRDMCTTPSWPRGRWGPRRDRDEAVVTPRGGLEDRRVLADATSLAELSMGPFCVIRSKPTNHLTDPTQPNRTHYRWKDLEPTRPDPTQYNCCLSVNLLRAEFANKFLVLLL